MNPLATIINPMATAEILQNFSGHPAPMNCLEAGLTKLSTYTPLNTISKPAVITVISPLPVINAIAPPSINKSHPVAVAADLPLIIGAPN
ncbi:hypothetical protein MCON_1427 [Methanothrix soehngenii GP6]|jgi:hypothetical protein|uniref:Uncharacterized protein n=1 Tax=Methanothrix soehngenii (strain ATCC 5969 / DSM 3671 / JCM 10134 / NBRC 103675 / OCM 69 / GP-6) TaxID=990316 RepID=F4BSX9_METSG|nr:hypothetical protein MCON_1427 [Methanothrix soehngenii GP6]